MAHSKQVHDSSLRFFDRVEVESDTTSVYKRTCLTFYLVVVVIGGKKHTWRFVVDKLPCLPKLECMFDLD